MNAERIIRHQQMMNKLSEYLRSFNNFPILMLAFTFALIELVWMIVYYCQSPISLNNTDNGQLFLLLPLGLIFLSLPFRNPKISRTTRGITLFLSVVMVTVLLVILGMKSWESFSLGLTLALSVFSGAACSMIMYMDNLKFIRQRIDLISKMEDSDNQKLVIQQTMREAQTYFDNTMRGIFSILSIIVIVFSVIWALSDIAS